MTTLYHGTSEEAANAIRETGFICGPVFLTPSRSTAEGYGEEVISVSVADDSLMIDLDMPGAKLLSVTDAAEYLGEEWDIAEFIRRGYSVGVANNVAI